MGEYIGINPYEIEVRYLFELAPLRIIVVCEATIICESFYLIERINVVGLNTE